MRRPSAVPSFAFLPAPAVLRGLGSHEPAQQSVDRIFDAGLRPAVLGARDAPRGEAVEQAEQRLTRGGRVTAAQPPLLPQPGPGLLEQLLHLERGTRRRMLLGARSEQ